MPELPEVETIVRHLWRDIGGKRIARSRLLWERLVAAPTSDRFVRHLPGRRIVAIDRRGKYILIHLDDGYYWIIHLRMTGRFRYLPPGTEDAEERHLRFVARFDDGSSLRFISPRKFARFYLVPRAEMIVGHLGLEPLSVDFTAEALAEALRHRRQAIKPLLMGQAVVAGLGNIYTCEALWRAGIDPRAAASTLTTEEIEALREAIVAVLVAAIRRGGSTLGDGQYLTPDGARGEAQEALGVYGKAGQPCPRCGTPIIRFVQGGRSTYACPHCQGIVEANEKPHPKVEPGR